MKRSNILIIAFLIIIIIVSAGLYLFLGRGYQIGVEAPEKPSAQEPNLKSVCCVQCSKAASIDPRAMDISIEPCISYESAEMLTPECIEYFENNPLSVRECRIEEVEYRVKEGS